MKVKVLQSYYENRRLYKKGEVIDLDDSRAENDIRKHIVEAVVEQKKETSKKTTTNKKQ